MSHSRAAWIGFGIPALALLAIQLVPYGRDHANPPAGRLAAWDSPRTEELARRACFDCHSNQTRWPWYAAVAPVSWRIQTHVAEGRTKLNFTAFDPGSEKMTEASGEAAETVTKGEMPPLDYALMHPEARLSAAEKQALANGLQLTFADFAGRNAEHAEGRGEGGEHESGGPHR